MNVAVLKRYPIIKKSTILLIDDDSHPMALIIETLRQQEAKVIVMHHSADVLTSLKCRSADIFILNINCRLYDAGVKVRQVRKVMGGDAPFLLLCDPLNIDRILDIIDLAPVGHIKGSDTAEQIASRVALALTPKEFSVQYGLYKQLLLRAISTFVKGKRLEIIKYIIDNCNEEYIFHGSYETIAEQLDVSKPTVVNLFRQLINAGLITRVCNKTYRLNIVQQKVTLNN